MPRKTRKASRAAVTVNMGREPGMNIRFVASLSFVSLLLVCLPVFAHHGAAAYDESKEVVLKNATVTKYTWANPHTIIEADVKDEKGNLVHWVGEVGSPSAISNQGWTKVSIAPGDVITIYIHQSKTGRTVGRISHVVLPDGTQLRDSAGTSGVVEGAPGGGNRSRGGDAKN
jgi:hypothetical protein